MKEGGKYFNYLHQTIRFTPQDLPVVKGKNLAEIETNIQKKKQ